MPARAANSSQEVRATVWQLKQNVLQMISNLQAKVLIKTKVRQTEPYLISHVVNKKGKRKAGNLPDSSSDKAKKFS